MGIRFCRRFDRMSVGFDELYLIPIEIFLSFDLILNDEKGKLFFGKLSRKKIILMLEINWNQYSYLHC